MGTGKRERFALLLFACGVCGVAAAQGVGSHLSVGVLGGDAPGLGEGYVRFGGFVPLSQRDPQSLCFADGGLLLYSDATDEIGGNAGFGSRAYCEGTGTILGSFFYYDRRDLGLVEFDQVSLGVESLGERVDARFAVNTPVGERTQGSGATLARSLATIDGELGALLAERSWAQLRAFVGVYGLFHGAADDAAGVRGRVEARLADQWFVGGYVEHDPVFNTTGGFTLEYRFGRGPSASDESSETLLARLGDPVVRRTHVMVADSSTPGLSITSTGGPGFVDPPSTPDGGVDDPPGRPYRPPPRGDLPESLGLTLGPAAP